MNTSKLIRLYFDLIINTIGITLTGTAILLALFWLRLLINYITN